MGPIRVTLGGNGLTRGTINETCQALPRDCDLQMAILCWWLRGTFVLRVYQQAAEGPSPAACLGNPELISLGRVRFPSTSRNSGQDRG